MNQANLLSKHLTALDNEILRLDKEEQKATNANRRKTIDQLVNERDPKADEYTKLTGIPWPLLSTLIKLSREQV